MELQTSFRLCSFVLFVSFVWLSQGQTPSAGGTSCTGSDAPFKAAVQSLGSLHGEIKQVAYQNSANRNPGTYLSIVVGIQTATVTLQNIHSGGTINGTACLSSTQQILGVIGAAIGHAGDNLVANPTGDEAYHDLVKRYGNAQIVAGTLAAQCATTPNPGQYLQVLQNLNNVVNPELGNVVATNNTGAPCQQGLKDLSNVLQAELDSVATSG